MAVEAPAPRGREGFEHIYRANIVVERVSWLGYAVVIHDVELGGALCFGPDDVYRVNETNDRCNRPVIRSLRPRCESIVVLRFAISRKSER